MSKVRLTKTETFARAIVQHYNPKKYWKLRERVINGTQYPWIMRQFWLFYLKRCDAYNNASMGTHIGYGAKFSTPPQLPHGLYGIIVSHAAVIGANAIIYHDVTIGNGHEGQDDAPVIGDNVYISAGAKITGKIRIGNNVTIGTNCVVVEDVPDNTLVVMNKPRVLLSQSKSPSK